MKKILQDGNRFISYNSQKSKNKHAKTIIFLHGLLSNMEGAKALFIEEHCKKRDYNFLRFDNFGHGESSGKFEEENITSWLEGALLAAEFMDSNEIIFIGSSMGGWIALLAAIKIPDKVSGIIGIAAAPDFTKELIWDKLPESSKQKLEQEKIIYLQNDGEEYTYPISKNLIDNGKKHLLLDKKINLNCPIHLIHGMKDEKVPYQMALSIASKVTSDDVTLKLIKDGDHRLSKDKNLQIIANSIDEIVK